MAGTEASAGRWGHQRWLSFAAESQRPSGQSTAPTKPGQVVGGCILCAGSPGSFFLVSRPEERRTSAGKEDEWVRRRGSVRDGVG